MKAMSRGISGANTSNRGQICLLTQNETTMLTSSKMYSLYFDKTNVTIVCCEDIYSR